MVRFVQFSQPKRWWAKRKSYDEYKYFIKTERKLKDDNTRRQFDFVKGSE